MTQTIRFSARAKTQYSLAVNKIRGLRNIASYALYSLLCLVLNREAAEDQTKQSHQHTSTPNKGTRQRARKQNPKFPFFPESSLKATVVAEVSCLFHSNRTSLEKEPFIRKTSGFEIEDNSKIFKSSDNTLYTCKIGEGRKENEIT